MRNQKIIAKTLTKNISNIKPEYSVLFGLLVSFIFFYLIPTFFLTNERMQTPDTLPLVSPIGVDFVHMLNYVRSWFIEHKTPYIGSNLYPPLSTYLFFPFILFTTEFSYKAFTIITLITFVLSFVIISGIISQKKINRGVWLILFIFSLFSYGLAFELERGQFNIISIILTLVSIVLFYKYPRFRFLSYTLFIIAVQMKVYPIIFIVFFIRDWKEWKSGLRRISLLGLVNLGSLFIMGFSVFGDFLTAITAQSKNPTIWAGNHSIKSFVYFSRNLLDEKSSNWVTQIFLNHPVRLEYLLLLISIICFLVILINSFINYRNKINPMLIFGCTILAMIIPSVSHDYKLSILFLPAFLILNEISNWIDNIKIPPIWGMLLLVMISFLFGSTLFSYGYKEGIIKNNFPALFILLLITVGLAIYDFARFQKLKHTTEVSTSVV